MSMEQKIDKAARKYALSKLPPEVECLPYTDYYKLGSARFDGRDIEQSFCDGAAYALSSQWRSVEEEMPNDLEDVFVVAVQRNYRNFGVAWVSMNKNGARQWYSNDGDLEKDFIRYWMPIPALPQERKEEEYGI